MVMSEAQKSAMPVDHCKIVPYERSRELVAPTSLRAQIFIFAKLVCVFIYKCWAEYHQ